jgi:anti-sigma B factor antagonist
VILHFTKRTLQSGVVAVEVQGSIHNGPDCSRLQREVDAMIAAGETRIIFDLAGLTHADSAAIGVIVRCLTKLKSAGGALRIAAAHPMIVHSLKLTKVDRLIEMFPTVEQASQGFLPPSPSSNKHA